MTKQNRIHVPDHHTILSLHLQKREGKNHSINHLNLHVSVKPWLVARKMKQQKLKTMPDTTFLVEEARILKNQENID